MTIHPFIAGILATLGIEALAIIITAAVAAVKKRRNGK